MVRESGDRADPAGAVGSTERTAGTSRESIHPVVRASGGSPAAEAGSSPNRGGIQPLNDAAADTGRARPGETRIDASATWGETALEVEGGSAAVREIAGGPRPSGDARDFARSPSTEDAGEGSARGDVADAARGSSPRFADDGDGEGEWLVPGERARGQQARDVPAHAEDGFDVVEEEIEDGRVVRSARPTVGERVEAERARRERIARTSSAASAEAVAGGSGPGSRSARAVGAREPDAASSANASDAADVTDAADAGRVDAGEPALAVGVVARRASAAARGEAPAEAQARGRPGLADGVESAGPRGEARPRGRSTPAGDGDGGGSRSGEGAGTAVVPRQRSVPVTASVGSTPTQARPAPPRAEAERPVVHVTIGRIEVRAVTPPAAPQPQPAPGWAPPVLTLDEYLKRGGNA
jgi:hypothetical protein